MTFFKKRGHTVTLTFMFFDSLMRWLYFGMIWTALSFSKCLFRESIECTRNMSNLRSLKKMENQLHEKIIKKQTSIHQVGQENGKFSDQMTACNSASFKA